MKTRIMSMILSMALLLSAITPAALAADTAAAAVEESAAEVSAVEPEASVEEPVAEPEVSAEEPEADLQEPAETDAVSGMAPELLAADVLVAAVNIGGTDTEYKAGGSVTEEQAFRNAWTAAQGKTAELTVFKSVTLTSSLNMNQASSNVTVKMGSGVELLMESGGRQAILVSAGKLTISGGGVRNMAAGSGSFMNYGVNISGSGSVTLTDSAAVFGDYGITASGTNTALRVESASVTGRQRGIHLSSGALEITDITVTGEEYGVWAGSGTSVTVSGGSFSGGTGLYINSANSVKLSGGQFAGVTNQGNSVGELLAEGYVYQQDGAWVTDTDQNSLTGTVQVLSVPVSVSGPQSIVIKRGTPAELSVSVDAAESGLAVSYQWYQVTEEVETALEGETGNTLRIETFPAEGDYTYFCRVSCMGLRIDSKHATVSVGDEYVAYVETEGTITGYSQLAAAFNAASGKTATITLLESIPMGDSNITIKSGNITLVGGDYYISSGAAQQLNLSGGTLTLDSGTIRNIGKRTSYAVYVKSAVLNVNGGIIENTGDGSSRYGVYVGSGATVNVHGGQIRGSGNSGIGVNIAAGGMLNVDGGTIYGTKAGVNSVSQGKAAFSGGSLDGSSAVTVSNPLTIASFLAPGCAYKRTDGWVYNADVRSIAGPVTVELTPMEITEMPKTDFMLLKDYTVGPTLTVKAYARKPEGQLVYQWYLNDVAIPGAGGASYTVPTGLGKQRYVYYCSVSCEGYSLSTAPTTVIVADEAFVCETPTVSAVYGQKLQELELSNPSGNSDGTWVWDSPLDQVGDAGVQMHFASFYPVESYIYDPVLHVAVNVTVAKSTPKIQFVEAYNLDKEYNRVAIPTPIRAHVTISGGKTDATPTFTWYKERVSPENRLSGTTGPKDVGDYVVVAELPGTNNAEGSTDQINVHITPKTVEPNIQLARNWIYTGEEIIPTVTVKDGDAVIPASEYTVTCTDNVQVGTAAVTITDNPGGNYIVNGESYFTIKTRSLVVVTATAENKEYDGLPQVDISAVQLRADGLPQIPAGDDVRVDVTDLTGEVYIAQADGHPNAGLYSYVVLHDLKLTGADAGNYTLVQPSTRVLLSGQTRITKTTLPQSEIETTLHVSTYYNYTYQWLLDDLRPTVEEPMQYANPECVLGSYDFSDQFFNQSGIKVTCEKNVLHVPVTLAPEVVGKQEWMPMGDVQLTLRFLNYNDIPCTVHLVAGGYITANIVGVESAGTEPYDGAAHAGYITAQGSELGKENVEPTHEGDPKPEGKVPFRIKYSGIDGTSHNKPLTAPTQAGKYRVTLEIAETEVNYIGTDSYEFEISKVAPAYVSEPTPRTGIRFNGQSQALLSAGRTEHGTLVYRLGEDGDFLPYIPTAIDAGTYTVYYKIQGDRNHTDSEEKSVEVTIDKSALSFSAPQVKEEIVYNGSQQLLITYPPRAVGGHIEYSMDGVNYSEEPPMAKDAGDYTFYYKGVGDENHSSTDVVRLQATISKRSVRVFTAEAEDRPYDGTDQVKMLSVVALKTVDGDDVQVDCTGLTGRIVQADGTPPEHPGVGEYGWVKLPFLHLAGDESKNYDLTQPENLVQLYTDVEITKAPLEAVQCTKEIKTRHAGTYTWSLLGQADIPEALKAFNEPAFTITEIAISSDFYKAETAEIRGSDLVLPILSAEKPPEEEPIGYVIVTASYPNYADQVYRFDLMAVDKTTAEITGVSSVVSTPYTGRGIEGYTGTPASAYKGSYDVYYEGIGETQYARSTTPPVAIGTYQVTISIPENDPNYAGSVTLEFEIVKAKPTVKAPVAKTGLVENGKEQALITAGSVTGGTMEYAMAQDGEYSQTIPAASKQGSYTVWYRVVGDANHEDIAPVSLTVMIRDKAAEPNVTVAPNRDGTVKISPDGAVPAGAMVTLTVSPVSGRELLEIVVSDQLGNRVALQKVGANIYTFVMPGTPVKITTAFTCDRGPNCSTYAFSDLDTTAWYHDAVEYVLEAGLMNGNGDGTFTPTENLSRAMLVQVLYNKAGKPAVKAKKLYTDVGPGDWYYDAVTWATENGVVEGNGDGTFEPEVDITREQLATMLWRYSGSVKADHAGTEFTDLSQADDWALDALYWAFDQRIMQGDGDGTIRPLDTAIRAEAATMLMNAWKNK